MTGDPKVARAHLLPGAPSGAEGGGESGIYKLLDRLERVRQTGRDSWRAPCPGHNGRNPSTLSISATDDGVVLLKCHAGCDVQTIVEAVGLSLTDLFPPRASTGRPQFRRPSRDWRGIVALLRHEVLVLHVALAEIAAGRTLSADDAKAFQRAASNLLRLEALSDV